MSARLLRVARMAAVAVAALVLLAAIAHGILWWQATEAIAREVRNWTAARAAEGLLVRHGPASRGGWPLRARLVLPDVAASGRVAVEGQGLLPLGFAADQISIELALLRPEMVRIAIGSPFWLSAGTALSLDGEAAVLDLIVPIGRDGDAPTRLTARRIAVRMVGDRIAADRFAAEQLDARVVRNPRATGAQPALALTLAAAGVELPAAAAAPLGERVGRAELAFEVIGQVPGAGSPQAQAHAWRDAGGYVQVPRLLLDWGPLSLSADARLALDQAAQPSGAGSARLSGLGPTLESLADAGFIPRQTAQAGRAIVALLQRAPAGGGPPVVELPLLLRDRTLSAGRFTLLRLPPIAWPP